jgi:ABC1 atypical kinase-like domain
MAPRPIVRISDTTRLPYSTRWKWRSSHPISFHVSSKTFTAGTLVRTATFASLGDLITNVMLSSPAKRLEFPALRSKADDTNQEPVQVVWATSSSTALTAPTASSSTTLAKIRRAWRLCKRLVQLSFTLGPVLLLYPLVSWLCRDDSSDENSLDSQAKVLRLENEAAVVTGLWGWYLRYCLQCVEHSGAAVIKLMQWAGSRPDLFGCHFCAVFSKLQDHTTPHAWTHTERALCDAYGEHWRRYIELHEVIGSGCIGQVYRGTILTGGTLDQGQEPLRTNDSGRAPLAVAVKVLHPGVHVDIDADLDLMRLAVRSIKYLPFDVLANLKWLNMEGVVEEFARLLKLQIDLRREAANLERFNANFRNDPAIEFPQLVQGFAPTDKVLVETFCPGVPVLHFCRQNQDNQRLLSSLCVKAIRAVCKMIFIDNFVRGTCRWNQLHLVGNIGMRVVCSSGVLPLLQQAWVCRRCRMGF